MADQPKPPKKKARKKPKPAAPEPVVARSWLPPWAGLGLVAVSTIYFAAAACEALGGWGWVASIPRPLHFFEQYACLFETASRHSIEFRAQGWECSRGAWREIDIRPFFPIDRDEKESRFQRALHFHSR